MQSTSLLAAAAALSEHTSDTELAARAAAGDARAFEFIMRRHNRLLFRTARSILRSDAETEDAVQEGYLSAWRAIGSFHGDARLSTWLVRIILNEALGRVRRRSAKIISLDMSLGPTDPEPEVPMESNADDQPERAAMRGQLRRLMESRIDGLPEAFRTVFMLRAVEEMSVEEVATALNIPEATVRSRFFRARSQLRETLSTDIDFATQDAFSFGGSRCDSIVARVLANITAASPAP